MRQTLLFASALLLHCAAQCQFLEVADQRTDRVQYADIAPLGADSWAILGWADRDFALGIGGNFVCTRNVNGQLLWNTEISVVTSYFDLFEKNADMEVFSDSIILVAGRWDQCDIMGQESAVALLNAAGQVEWETVLFTEDAALRMVAEGPASMYAVASNERVYLLDLAGDSATSWVPDLAPIKDLVWETDTTLLLLSDTMLSRYDHQGTLLATHSFNGTGKALMYHNGLALVLTADSILALDLNTSHVAYALDTYPGTPIRSIITNEGPKILTSQALIDFVDNAGPADYLEFELLLDQSLRDAAWSNGTAYTVSYVTSIGSRSGLMRTYTADGTSTSDADVSIAVQVDSSWFQPRIGPGPSNIYDILVSASAIVTNNGSTVVDDLLVFMQAPGTVTYCNTAAYNLTFSELGLEPGSTIVLPFEPHLWLILASEPGEAYNSMVCITALSPNNKVDRVPSDNSSCEPFSITNTVGIDDQKTEPRIAVYPNPFTDRMVLELQGSTSRVDVQLFDLQSRLVHSASFDGVQRTVMMELPDITEGTYVLQLRSGDVVRTQRVVRSAK
ncbi:MAG: T9SS type A sorting domain-containing protein [Flavobacteriales bacterium]|jgi:hypothetical protein|nr:T9SS type A sorting domain-containing protein [Flavobacteriales bacterium]MBK6549558.1 T9SS type A sorting domain-containing protein [Flavobacteriales bacterium]MBK6883854.1 T9SS type A sorting domain-containing protein [Flavobacteriales bacterium]MBK7100246.1 T9SS type A sorting domain-containing protein [Flavobacteriales bacterium]MBK7110939.1 T9SS type A sorting domain-containing protein [Flavobacteriales bacterium]